MLDDPHKHLAKPVVYFADIRGKDGLTMREQNMARPHNIPIGTLVEVKYEHAFDDGACEKVHARLWVIKQGRDCDGTPLYWLSKRHPEHQIEATVVSPGGIVFKDCFSKSMLNDHIGGFSEESLTPLELTEDVKNHKGAPTWEFDKSEITVEYVPHANDPLRVSVHLVSPDGETIGDAIYVKGAGGFKPFVTDFGINKGWRRRGLGTMLMRDIMVHFGPPIQVRAVPQKLEGDLEPAISLESLRQFYKDLGFQELGPDYLVWVDADETCGIVQNTTNEE